MPDIVAAPGPAPDTLENPVATTATRPHTTAPVIGQGPVTTNAPLNIAMGMGIAGASQAGFAAMTGDAWVLATSTFLNLVGQLVKGPKWFPEHKGLIIVMLVVSFVIGYFIWYGGIQDGLDRLRESFANMANSTMQAVLNYKADKAAGLNMLPPTKDSQ